MAEPARREIAWLAEFERDPVVAVDELLRGIADIAPYEREAPVEVLLRLFGGLHEHDPAHRALDSAVGAWLEVRRNDGPERRQCYGMSRYLAELLEALSAVYRLPLEETAAMLRKGLPTFERWLRPLGAEPGWDPAAELWRAVAIAQRDRSLLFHWYQLCEEAGRSQPEHYLDIGLLGLRHLPEPGKAEPAGQLTPEVLAGLFRWAARLSEGPANRKAFQKQVSTLMVLYPRAAKTWRERVFAIVDQYPGAPFKDWLSGLGFKAKPNGKGKPKGIDALPSKQRHEELLRRLQKEPIGKLLPEIRSLIRDHERYAEATGGGEFLVKTARNFSGKLRSRAPREALRLAKLAHVWEPSVPDNWNHWAAALEALGETERAEVVYWEAVRKFPEDEVSRNALANLLIKEGRTAEAENILRETMQRFEDDEVACNALAVLLAQSDRRTEAEELFRATMENFPHDRVAPQALVSWLLLWNRVPEADELYTEIRSRFSPNQYTRELASRLAERQKGFQDEPETPDLDAYPLPEPAEVFEVAQPQAQYGEPEPEIETVDLELDPRLHTNATVGRADLVLRTGEDGDTRSKALANVEKVLEADREQVYPRVVLALHMPSWRARVAENAGAFPHSYPIRFLAARESGVAEAWAQLRRDFHEHYPTTLLGRLATANGNADPADAERLAKWVEAGDDSRKGFDSFTTQRLRKWLLDSTSQTEPTELLRCLNAHKPEVEALLGDALRRSADEGTTYVP